MAAFPHSRSRFFKGMGRALDLGGVMSSRSPSRTPEEADWDALCRDWQTVGSDLRAAMRAYEAE